MTLYLAYAAKSFHKNLAYRSEVWLRIVISLIWVLIQVSIWRALLGQGAVNGISIRGMISYAILTSALSMLMVDRAFAEVDEQLRNGDVALHLIRPYQYPLALLADGLGRSAFSFVFSLLPTVVLATIAFGFSLPPTIAHGILFVAACLIALLLSFAIGSIVNMLGFYFLTTWHFQWLMNALKTLFAGVLVPLWFFPRGLRLLAEALPFQFLVFVPASIWIGESGLTDAVLRLLLGLLWTIALLALGWWMWNRITHRLVAQGG